MRTWYFSENAYPYLPDADTFDSIRVTLPNRYFDPKVGADLYHRYLDEWQLADELGLNVMVNEHHQTATNLNPSAAVVAATLARITKRARILILGNPIANRRDPVRVAEEMAMIDNYSRGRLDVGFVRGVPYELAAANSSPARMVERMWEAHDLILKAWTTHDGPFNWEGRFFHYRQVNIWPRPYQAPHPPVWITGTSTNNVLQVADNGHVIATFMTGFDQTKRIFDAYRARRASRHLPMNDDRLAYAALVYVGDTDEEGYAGAEKLLWYLRANKVPPQFKNPPGYLTPEGAAQMIRAGDRSAGAHRGVQRNGSLSDFIAQGVVFAGNPDTVTAQIRRHYDHVGGYGHLLMMGQAGFLEHAETEAGIRRFATEVAPRISQFMPLERELVATGGAEAVKVGSTSLPW
jgi:alkanesulfonate monooxygenase SsuD/methylene tetrahydromethanopterin reductase-like flavin-dependent oxidoreductase (luciferase family)